LRDEIAIIAVRMTKSRTLLDRLLHTPDLARVVPHLQPAVLHRVIQTCGLEDSAEVIALATPAQISRILDIDVWRAPIPGMDESFDAERFGTWLEVLMQAGGAAAARLLLGLDLDLVVAGFARHLAVFDRAAVSEYTTLDGQLSGGRSSAASDSIEMGGYVVEARRTGSWDAIVQLLSYLGDEHPEYFNRVMQGCRRLSDGAREEDASHNLLDDNEQEMFDLSSARESRRERDGYVPPSHARAFLQMARELRVADEQPPAINPLVRAYFRGVESPPLADDATSADRRLLGEATHTADADVEPAKVAAVTEILRDEGVLQPEPRFAMLGAFLQAHESEEQLAYLANTLLAGCSLQRRSFTPAEASEAAGAVCNLGFENWPHRWSDRELIAAFQVGMTVLHGVSLYVAERLAGIVAELKCGDRDIQIGLSRLRFELTTHYRDKAPWRARTALDVIMLLDAPSWAALTGLLDEFPVMHGAITAALTARSKARAVDPSAFEFISQNSQIASIHAFIEALPDALTGKRSA
jgi:uncharacterized protein DUF6178